MVEAVCLNERATYVIQVQGRLDPSWTEWFDEMTITRQVNDKGEWMTILTGKVADQPALRGLLSKVWDLNLTVWSVTRVERD